MRLQAFLALGLLHYAFPFKAFPRSPKLQNSAPDNFGIVEPFPRNIFAIEFTSANVTCVAYDSLRIKIPEKIIFVRRDEFGRHHEITANGKLYFTERTEENRRKLFVTLHFLYITMPDDSRYGPYECDAFAVNDPVARKHGFSVTVLRALPVSSRIHPRPSTVAASPASSRIPPKPSTGDECLRYKVLPEADRSQTYDYRKVSGGYPICDNTLQRDWYRFVGLAGDRMPHECVPSHHCGTHAAGWLRGEHPLVHDGVVSKTVCYHWINNCCWRSNNILVRNCGGFFVYRLQKPPGCQYRYCGVGSPVQISSSECLHYKNLTKFDRAKGYKGVAKCDRSLSRGWYRFQGLAGKQMPDACVPKQRCGTHAPGWLRGGHPTVTEGAVTRKVCFHWSSGCCQLSTNIRVRNCGAFFVYKLSPPPACSLRYCGDREQAPTSAPECTFYQVLDRRDRAQGYIGVGKCDISLAKAWYRFKGRAGKQMPQSCVPKHRCGTHAPGWLDGQHPTMSEGAVKRKVCFHWSNSCCRYSSSIRVRNCGAFYVYELDSTGFCSLRYCGDRM
ncbi:uncharacterized protein LOC110055930 isoform X3 [Orbicella faveolata]|uniref:uncharacterized protein LOC110055930 isoform X3 n=1 Tax=Orbicella faveolata TaxID=48498 RepID=UPI0009E30180|nr:uncharacterized protein LOC110055930 isoform X3 [Orbicella faveolata]